MAPCTQPQAYTRSRKAYSALQHQRLAADCREYLPRVLEGRPEVRCREAVPASAKDSEKVRALFPNTYDAPSVEFAASSCGGEPAGCSPVKVGVMLSGGQAPGGHNVIAGLFDGLKQWHEESSVIGFLDGPKGVIKGNFVEVTADIVDGFRNTGGFDMLGSGRHKIETEEQFKNPMEACSAIDLDGLVVIGGDGSNTYSALLAEYFKAHGCKTKVIGVPKTIDGDLKCPPHIPVSFGFDTACKTYASLVGNVAVDALSAQKYYHMVRLMGRAASNISLEVALLTRPNLCFLGEEVVRDGRSLQDLTLELADLVEQRSSIGKEYGVVLIPEGLIEFIPEFNALISEINVKLAIGVEPTQEAVLAALSPANAAAFHFLPDFIRAQMLLERDVQGKVNLSGIETEKLLAATLAVELEARRAKGSYSGSFRPQFHSFGFEGRSGLPSIFDSAYCYALGATTASLIVHNCTGLIASVKNLLAPVKEWQCGGVPVASLCVIERHQGKEIPVICKALVELRGEHSQPFQAFQKIREDLRLSDSYSIPGPMQFDGANCPAAREIPITLQLEMGKSLAPIQPKPPVKRMGRFLHIPQTKESRSELQQWRMARRRQVPAELAECSIAAVEVLEGTETVCFEHEQEVVHKFFSCTTAPLLEIKARDERGPVPENQTVGIVFCGRQAAGCHDLICGLVDALRTSEGSKVLGFVGGTRGFFEQQAIELTPDLCAAYHGTGGLELLGRTIDRIHSHEEIALARVACTELGLTSLVLVGGARTSTDAAYLAEDFRKQELKTAVVGVPCGMEGSMVNEFVEASLGFDTAAKTMAQLVGNTTRDGASSRKYYWFMKLMDGSSIAGRTPTSHVALEAALQTKPNMLLLTEEVDERRLTLRDVVKDIADMVAQRAHEGKNFGAILVAEGLLAAIPEFRSLISELEALPKLGSPEEVMPLLTLWSRALLQSMPEFIQKQLLLERQSNAALQLSWLETERLLAWLVQDEMVQRKKQGSFSGSFTPMCQSHGYQARCSMPSNFDSDYGYALGITAAVLAASGRSGYMAVISDLKMPVRQWRSGGVPFTAMLRVQPATAQQQVEWPRPAIFASRVDLEGPAFREWVQVRRACAKGELYENPGPIQFSGATASAVSKTIAGRPSYLKELNSMLECMARVSRRCRPGCDPRLVHVAVQSLSTLETVLDQVSEPVAPVSVA